MPLRRSCLVAAIPALLLCHFASAAVPAVLCPIVSARPVVDGRLDDVVWTGVPVCGDFWDNTGQHVADPPMEFRVCTDGRWLYLGINLTDPRTDAYGRQYHGHDQIDWRDEVLDVFFARGGDSDRFFHFALNPNGSDFDSVVGGTHLDSNFTWKHAQRIHETGWTAEIALPLRELGAPDGVVAGDRLALNVCRETRPLRQLHAWSPTGPSLQNRQALGDVVVGGFAALGRKRTEELSRASAVIRQRIDRLHAANLDAVDVQIEGLRDGAEAISSSEQWLVFREKALRIEKELGRLGEARRSLVVWAANPYELPGSGVLPEEEQAEVEEVAVTLFRGERAIKAVAVSNLEEGVLQTRCVTAQWSSETGDMTFPFSAAATLRHAPEVALLSGGVQRDPLPAVRLEDVFTIGGKRSEVLWLSMDSQGLPPGAWFSSIRLHPLVHYRQRRDIRLRINVLPVAFPRSGKPHGMTWAYLDRQPCKPFPDACVRDLAEHGIDVHVVRMADTGIKTMTFDEMGRVAEGPDFTALGTWIERFGSAGQFYVLLNYYGWIPVELGGRDNEIGLTEQGNFRAYATKLRSFLASKGVGIDQFAHYPWDEPSDETAASGVVSFGKLLAEADPEQRALVTVSNAATVGMIKQMIPHVDIWVPNLDLADAKRAAVKADADALILSYSVLTRESSPYFAYRLSGLKAFKQGYSGIGFWSYNDCGSDPNASVWDDLDRDQTDCSVIYEGSSGPVPSVRWESWRLGAQDYRWCAWLTELTTGMVDQRRSDRGNQAVKTMLQAVLGEVDTRLADAHCGTLRGLAIDFLKTTGKLKPEGVAFVDRKRPLCLTRNGGSVWASGAPGVRYTYDPFPPAVPYGERCGIEEGWVETKGAEAQTGKQAENAIDGDLTDGRIGYPDDFCIFSWPPPLVAVVFDFGSDVVFSHAHLWGDDTPVRAFVSRKGEGGSWLEVADLGGVLAKMEKTAAGWQLIGLKGTGGRFLRLEFRTNQRNLRLGEVRVFGWPAQ
ncbi:MAG: DUF4091 domain-containing protein [Lentisphaerae bacterium]|jgi:hypothetical protein|nr:DUF4091 domain-containing protein [Lentisphaerota bacterium]MBT4816119.1 DUF4091 domain-containing protein [Lentisphaerota bacterium]MBT5608405.1 DUF4091 domain-containing protein [Lentisphaerota bacterium]MBT7054975.1 DUF4091 domain-containing protein [Lentisphaerota bacterium]MBT7844828.1 DUF4091 domain-containing protein [Lentisphaerota bacterium]